MEFALVVGIFVFVLYGLISFGMILATKQRITNGAAEGARAAVGQTTDAAAKSVAIARITQALGTPGTTYTIDPGVGEPTTALRSEQVHQGDHHLQLGAHPVVPPAPGLGLVTPSTISSTAVVQYS